MSFVLYSFLLPPLKFVLSSMHMCIQLDAKIPGLASAKVGTDVTDVCAPLKDFTVRFRTLNGSHNKLA